MRGGEKGAPNGAVHAERLRRLGEWAAYALIALGVSVLASWAFDWPARAWLGERWVPIKPNAALAFALAGVALALRARNPQRAAGKVEVACALAVVALGGATAVEHAADVDLGIDGLLFGAAAPQEGLPFPLRMPVQVSVGFVLLGLSSLVSRSERGSSAVVSTAATVALYALGFLGLTGYVYGAPQLEIGGAQQTIALHGALAFLIASGALVALAPRRGLGALVTTPGAGGLVVRRLLPLAIVLPIACGALQIAAESAGLVSHRFGFAVSTVATEILAIVVVVWVARRLHAAELERQRSEAARSASSEAESRARSELSDLVEQAPVGIARSTVDGRFLGANPAFVRMLGYESFDELRRIDIPTELYRDPADRAAVLAQFRSGSTEGIEVDLNRRDGSAVRARLRGRVSAGGANHATHEVFAEDVTQTRALELQLERAQRLESLGRLAAGVAHDFNNLAGVARGYAELLTGHFAPESREWQWSDEIVRAIDRAAALTQQLLALGSQQASRPEPLDLGEVLERTHSMLHRLIGDQIQLEVDIAPGLGRVTADRAQIEQVILNLAVNARDAMPAGGRLVCAVSNVEVDAAEAAARPGLIPGSYVRLQVSDDGCGMDAATLARVFEPFFTTKGPGKGSGLGLATVYGIVRQSGGYVSVASNLGEGTTFGIYLPRTPGAELAELAEVEAPRPPADLAASNPAGRGETVLLVEDEDALRRVTALMLARQGYDVLQAAEPAVARRLAAMNRDRLALLVCDMRLAHGASGVELADELRAELPRLPVLFVSGYADSPTERAAGTKAGEEFLAKPFSARELARMAGDLLATARTAAPERPRA